MERYFVITGGPGSGKTTLVDALSVQGIRTMPEAGRAIIRHQVAIGGQALPWGDRRAFAEQMLAWEMRSWHEAADEEGAILFDRGIPDILGYLTLGGIAIPKHIARAAKLFGYNPRVFVAPPWRAIYAQDAERKQSWIEAEATCDAVARAYSDFGYELVRLPLVPVGERVRFVLDRLNP
jgi:predicted ATPase